MDTSLRDMYKRRIGADIWCSAWERKLKFVGDRTNIKLGEHIMKYIHCCGESQVEEITDQRE